MGRMKDFLIRISESMGFEGDINDEVIDAAQDRLAQHADFLLDQRREHGINEAVTQYLKNHGTNENSSRKRSSSGDDETR